MSIIIIAFETVVALAVTFVAARAVTAARDARKAAEDARYFSEATQGYASQISGSNELAPADGPYRQLNAPPKTTRGFRLVSLTEDKYDMLVKAATELELERGVYQSERELRLKHEATLRAIANTHTPPGCLIAEDALPKP